MKGQISVVEAIIAIVALFIAFNILISAETFQSKWKEAITTMEGKDILITLDRLGKLHNYPFSLATFKSEFLNKIETIKDVIVNIDTQGTVKSTTYIACDCTTEQINYLKDIFDDVKFNERNVNVEICPTLLPSIDNCGSKTKYPDILIIWGYKNLEGYVNTLNDFLDNGNGIIEIADIGEANIDTAQQTIFGLKWVSEGGFPSGQDEFLKPRNASAIPYQSYKWFYHLPYLLTGTQDTTSFQMEGDSTITCNGKTGTFKFQDNSFQFWICVNNQVYFDTSIPQNNKADTVVNQGEEFQIAASTFLLNYIDSISKIRISFKPDYNFKDFLVKDNAHNKLFPIGDDKTKVLLSLGFWDLLKERPRGAAILNEIKNAKTIWLADFSRNGLAGTGDDHKQLLASLVFSLSNKQIKESFSTIGEITSYINVVNKDMLEIYKVDLEIGAPF